MIKQEFAWPTLLAVSFDTLEEQAEAEALLVKLGGVVQLVLPPKRCGVYRFDRAGMVACRI